MFGSKFLKVWNTFLTFKLENQGKEGRVGQAKWEGIQNNCFKSKAYLLKLRPISRYNVHMLIIHVIKKIFVKKRTSCQIKFWRPYVENSGRLFCRKLFLFLLTISPVLFLRHLFVLLEPTDNDAKFLVWKSVFSYPVMGLITFKNGLYISLAP